MTRFGITAFSAATIALLASLGGDARAETQVIQQVLDRVTVFNLGTALEMKFDAADQRPPDFFNFDLVESSGLGSCQLNGSRGLYCLDGRDVRRWQDPADGGPGLVEFSCANPALQLDARRGNPCSAIAVAQNGDLWISGRRSNAYQLIKLVRKDADGHCSEGSTLSPTNGVPAHYCFQQYASGRPLLNKLVVVEGEEAEKFDPGTGVPSGGVLGLDVRNAVTYFGPSPDAMPVDLVAGKTDWGLGNKEALLDLALLQVANGSSTGDQTDNYLLAISSTGRVLARQTDQVAAATTIEAFDVPAERTAPTAPPPAQCDTSGQRYGIAASTKSGRVYVTDRNYCQVLALQPAGPPFMGLVNVPDDNSSLGADLTLATAYDNPDPSAPVSDSGTYPPDGATVAPGIVINLTECVGSCTLIADEANEAAASLFAVELNSPESRMVLYQVRNIPDCRYVPTDPDCIGKDAVFTPPGKPAVAAEQYLDVARLLPPDVTSQFPSIDTPPPGLPPLLISPQYRGQSSTTKNYRFGAIFAIPEPGVVFKNVFELEFDIEKLADSELGCRLGYGPQTPLADLLRWDVATWVSERFIAPGGPYGLATQYESAPGTMAPNKYRYVDTIINTGCRNPLKSKGTGFSMIAYDLEIAHNPILGGDDQDDIFARLVDKLFQDLKLAQTELTCPGGVDTATSDPLSDSVCSSLGSTLLNAEDKLAKCIAATQQPKTSAVDQNCQAFETQFSAYRSQLAAIGPASATLDPANRIGGLKARSETLWHVYVERFLPSVPQGGFSPSPTP